MFNEIRLRELARDAAERGGMAIDPRRERGLWSFLTWSFFLAQLAAGSAFASGAAQAASSTADTGTSAGADTADASSSSLVGRPDTPVAATAEPELAAAQNGATPVQPDSIFAAEKMGGIEQLDFTSDAGLELQLAAMPNSAMLLGGTVHDAGSDGGAIAPDLPQGAEASIDLPQAVELPPLLDSVLPPVLETVDNLVDDLGPALDDLLVPVVETVEDLASVLGPTLDQALAPVETLADSIAGALEDTLDPVLTPVTTLAEGVGDIIEPVGGIAGEIVGLADPVLDTIQPVLSPVLNVVEAAEPLLDPVLEVAAPVADLIAPVAEPLLLPLAPTLAPTLAPVLEILPLQAATGGILDGLMGGGGETDAVGSPGGIALAVETEAGGYDLMEAGAYTELGITLHDTPLDIADNAGDLIGNVAEPIGDLLDDADDGNTLPGLLGHLQHEIALRGLGEGLI